MTSSTLAASEAFEQSLAGLAKEYGLTIIEEPGFTGPCYRLMSRKDADQYMALVYGHVPLKPH